LTSTRSLSVVCLLAILCSTCGCVLGYSTATPSDTVNSYLDAVQWLDLQGLNGLVVPSQRLDDAALKALRDNVSAATQRLNEWQLTITNRSLTVQQNGISATVNVSADLQVTVKVRGERQINQTRLQGSFELELVGSQWLVVAYRGADLLPSG